MTAVEMLSTWLAEAPSTWPDEAWHQARRSFIDTVGVMIAGAREPATRIIDETVTTWGVGKSVVFGSDQKQSPPFAALVGGTAAHALDFDDNFDPAKAHASAVLVPAIMAAGDDLGATGRQALDAYIIGLQVMGRVGQGVNPFHRARGWHATATLGTIGAAAAVARLLKLDAIRAAHAISLSTSMAGGFMSQFGTMTKPAHAGLAAQGGIMAAYMAASGLTAGTDTLDGPQGMGTLMVGPDIEILREEMQGKAEHGQTMTFQGTPVGEPLHILEYGLKVKRFPNCGSIHRALDGLLELRSEHGLGPDNVARIVVRAPRAHLNNLMYERPVDGMQAKFSLEYGLACGLVTGGARLADYTDEAVMRPDVRREMEKVIREPVDKLESEFDTEVHITLVSGDVVKTSIHMPVGSKDRPMTDEQLWDKFDACVSGVLCVDASADLKQSLMAMGSDEPLSFVTSCCQHQ